MSISHQTLRDKHQNANISLSLSCILLIWTKQEVICLRLLWLFHKSTRIYPLCALEAVLNWELLRITTQLSIWITSCQRVEVLILRIILQIIDIVGVVVVIGEEVFSRNWHYSIWIARRCIRYGCIFQWTSSSTSIDEFVIILLIRIKLSVIADGVIIQIHFSNNLSLFLLSKWQK